MLDIVDVGESSLESYRGVAPDDLLDAVKAFGERDGVVKSHPDDAVSWHGRDSGGILEHAFDEVITAGLERQCGHQAAFTKKLALAFRASPLVGEGSAGVSGNSGG